MAYQDQKETAPGNEGAASPMEGALNVFNATSKNMQAIAGQIFDISKHSFEHTTQTLEKLRSAHGMDEVVAFFLSLRQQAG
jgi:Phasin protein